MKKSLTVFRKVLAAALTGLFLLVLSPAAVSPAASGGPVLLLDIKGAIGPATSDYLRHGLEKGRQQGARLVVLQMDTPGGLDTSMREIIQDILNSPIPVVTFVSPKGARAASAGTYILYASHISAMAPATNLGAATPIQIGISPIQRPPAPGMGERGKMPEKGAADGKDAKESAPAKPHPTIRDKAVNDAVAYIQSLAQLRGRNAAWAEKAVTEAASLSAEAALKANVIDLMADDLRDLLGKLDARTVAIKGDARPLAGVAAAGIVAVAPNWRTKLLAVLTTPNLVLILFLAGVYGLIFEFTNPGAIVPGVIGGIALLLALFGLNVLPINFAGLGLILLGLIFMVAEAFLPSFGALGIGGVIAFIIGSVILMDTDVPGFQVSRALIGSVAGFSAALFTVIIVLAVKSRRRPVVSGQEEMVGSFGEVADWSGGQGRVRIHGEIWNASSSEPLDSGGRVRVDGINGLDLIVHPAEKEEEKRHDD